MTMKTRKSSRRQSLSAESNNEETTEGTMGVSNSKREDEPPTPKRKKATLKKTPSKKKKQTTEAPICLPRNQEKRLAKQYSCIMGVDEAGRGPLAGPVVAAAAMVPQDVPGICDSKRLTTEEAREHAYNKLMQSAGIQWAVAVVDAKMIDEINILQATMRAMEMATRCLMDPDNCHAERYSEVSARHDGCYVVHHGEKIRKESCFALIDGNRVPGDMPCEAESMVKGDSKEYLIAAASILAKVSRDRIMHEYDITYPQYQLSKHKGYPTKAHMELVKQSGASPIHRRTFAPLKHMQFDIEGEVVDE